MFILDSPYYIFIVNLFPEEVLSYEIAPLLWKYTDGKEPPFINRFVYWTVCEGGIPPCT